MSQSLLLQGCFRTAGLGDVSRPGGLNPFYFRAAFGQGFDPQQAPSVRSQSLLLQGCFRTEEGEVYPLPRWVSIPFTSGLLSDVMSAVIVDDRRVSIPFTSGLLSD